MAPPVDDPFDLERVKDGADISVDFTAIERSLAEIWRGQSESDEDAVTRAALWNVVAHTVNDADRILATETLGRASASVPQRTIVIRSSAGGQSELSSWISANCHLLGGARQVCSEEISIVAGGHRIHDVPSLVNALLIPDMPVSAWWIGDLPSGQDEYVQTLLQPADRFMIDSVHFDSNDDLRLVTRISGGTDTLPADLNWIRLEEWRVATASVFDPWSTRSLLDSIASVRVVSAVSGSGYFGDRIGALFFAAWFARQLGHRVTRDGVVSRSGAPVTYALDEYTSPSRSGEVLHVEIDFSTGGHARLERSSDGSAIVTVVNGVEHSPSSVTRCVKRDLSDLIVRQLSHRDEDTLFPEVLPLSVKFAEMFVS